MTMPDLKELREKAEAHAALATASTGERETLVDTISDDVWQHDASGDTALVSDADPIPPVPDVEVGLVERFEVLGPTTARKHPRGNYVRYTDHAATVAKLTTEQDYWKIEAEGERAKVQKRDRDLHAAISRVNALEKELTDLKRDIERQVRASGELATENERLRVTLDVAAQKFDAIRKILIGHLDEPERSAFWTAVEAQRIARAALGEMGE